MGYRVIFLANPVKLSTKNEQLLIDNGEVTKVPLEDIECIVADTLQLNITARLLTKSSGVQSVSIVFSLQATSCRFDIAKQTYACCGG